MTMKLKMPDIDVTDRLLRDQLIFMAVSTDAYDKITDEIGELSKAIVIGSVLEDKSNQEILSMVGKRLAKIQAKFLHHYAESREAQWALIHAAYPELERFNMGLKVNYDGEANTVDVHIVSIVERDAEDDDRADT